jgi:hypothetical protein
LLAGALVLSAVSLLRVPALDTRLGVGAVLAQLGIAVVALLLDARRLRG